MSSRWVNLDMRGFVGAQRDECPVQANGKRPATERPRAHHFNLVSFREADLAQLRAEAVDACSDRANARLLPGAQFIEFHGTASCKSFATSIAPEGGIAIDADQGGIIPATLAGERRLERVGNGRELRIFFS
jgi:hypothetical protein